MRGTREIKTRIKSVQSTQKITRAMEMVAAAKLRRAEERAEAARPYARSIKNSIARILENTIGIDSPLMEARDSTKKCLVVYSSDRGLCGSYNTNILRRAVLEAEKYPKEQVSIVAIGRKARDFFRRREYNIIREFLDIEDRPGIERTRELVTYLLELFNEGEAGEIYLLYNEFVNVMIHHPRCLQLLPVASDAIKIGEEEKAEVVEGERQTKEQQQRNEAAAEELIYQFEPEPEIVLDALLSRLLNSLVLTAFLEAKASELGSRMTAMKTATENAKDMIARLTLEYNKARQGAITQEILEIVNTSEALSK